MAIALAKSFVVSVFPVPIEQHLLHHDDLQETESRSIRHPKEIHLMKNIINSVSQKTEDIIDQ